jgi:hypothetical protein
MSPREQSVLDRRRAWRALGMVVVACLLTINLATRYSFFTTAPTSSISVVTAHADGMTQQHLDKDGLGWVSPVFRAEICQVAAFYPRFAPAGPPVHNLLLENSLYNRPPPFDKFVS